MNPCIIISRSARALAESAFLEEIPVIALDCFDDTDLNQIALCSEKIGDVVLNFDDKALMNGLRRYCSTYPDAKLVIGSGFESGANLLNKLGNFTSVISNDSNLIGKLKNPEYLTDLCQKNNINFPSLIKQSSIKNQLCLQKTKGSEGGVDVKWATSENAELCDEHYLQTYIKGKVMSAVFLSNGVKPVLIGVNEQFQTDEFEAMPFLYAGAITSDELTDAQQQSVKNILNALVQDTNLRGLCGIDFIVAESGDIYLIEVNPRPPATFELHETRPSLFALHLDCFNGEFPNFTSRQKMKYRGYRILYAKGNVTIPTDMIWPDWTKDKPKSASKINKGQPICTIHASADSNSETKQLLQERINKIESEIHALQNAA